MRNLKGGQNPNRLLAPEKGGVSYDLLCFLR